MKKLASLLCVLVFCFATKSLSVSININKIVNNPIVAVFPEINQLNVDGLKIIIDSKSTEIIQFHGNNYINQLMEEIKRMQILVRKGSHTPSIKYDPVTVKLPLDYEITGWMKGTYIICISFPLIIKST